MATLVNVDNKAVNMRKQLDQFKEESEKVRLRLLGLSILY
jgi:hypothetical protein